MFGFRRLVWSCKFWIVLFWHSEPCNINKFSLDDKGPKPDISPESSAAARCPSVSYFKAPPPLDILKAVSRGMKSELRSQTFNLVCSAFTYTIICSKPLLKDWFSERSEVIKTTPESSASLQHYLSSLIYKCVRVCETKFLSALIRLSKEECVCVFAVCLLWIAAGPQ